MDNPSFLISVLCELETDHMPRDAKGRFTREEPTERVPCAREATPSLKSAGTRERAAISYAIELANAALKAPAAAARELWATADSILDSVGGRDDS